VSAYLDQSDARSRIRGMRIAKEFSILLGQDVNFDELEEEDRRTAQEVSVGSVASSGTPSSSVSKVTATQSAVRSDESDDDSSDSEIEGYDMPDEDVEDVITLTNYLGVCLDQLLCQDNDKDAHDKQLSALLSIPKIILTSPMDAGNMCGPLVKELLRLNNSYNTMNFDGLRSEAVLSIAVVYPLFAVPVLTWALEEESYSLSVKIFAISCLTKAAYSLSNSPDESGSDVNTTSTSSSTSAFTLTTSGKTTLKKGNKSDTISSNENDPSSIIKRPAKLALSHKKVTYFVNKFGPLGPIFFYPILRLISIEIVRNSSKSITTSNKNVENKQKLSFFSTDLDAVDEKFLDFFSKNGLYGSSGKIPEMKKCIDDDDGDGLHSMVPTEALLALGTFCKCSVNSVYQRSDHFLALFHL
jgi:Telomere length regulation protein